MKLSAVLKQLVTFFYTFGLMLVIAGVILTSVNVPVQAASGSIWTTSAPCDKPAPQDQNHYNIWDTVHIRGSGFDPNKTYDYKITGNPGESSGDPGKEVASGSVTADNNGDFCVAAYTVQPDDWGEYTVDVLPDKN